MKRKHRLAIVLSRFPYPLEKGDKLRAYHQIRQLSEEFDIYLLCLCEDRISHDQILALEPYVVQMTTYRLSKWSLPFRLILYTLIRCWPAQVSYFFSPILSKRLNAQLDWIEPHIIYNQLPRTISYVRHRSEPKAIDLMDAFSYGMSKRSMNSSGAIRWLYRWESRAIRKYESRTLASFQIITMISAQDRVRSPHLADKHLHIVPNGVETSHLEARIDQRHSDLVFVGNLGYQPNIDAVHYLVEEILPKYFERYGRKLTVAVAGARPSKTIVQLQSECVTVLGWQEDINDAYNTGQVFVAPIFHGMGQQNKLMEAIGCELPCVVSPEVAAPFNAKDGRELLIASSVDAFVNKIHLLLSDRIDVSLLKKTAKSLVIDTHTWKQQTQVIINQLKDLAKNTNSTA